MRPNPKDIVDQMFEKDAFSKWLGIELLEINGGYAKISLQIRDDMVNGFGVCHGGVTFAFADSALAFASNTRGRMSVAIENNINYTKKVSVGDILVAETEEIQNGRTIGVYKVKITNQKNELVAEFRGTVFRNKI
ncbi:MAG: hydroxyphenylacetyl-CoA thioesterase PaaI [Balneolaceae bacterium]